MPHRLWIICDIGTTPLPALWRCVAAQLGGDAFAQSDAAEKVSARLAQGGAKHFATEGEGWSFSFNQNAEGGFDQCLIDGAASALSVETAERIIVEVFAGEAHFVQAHLVDRDFEVRQNLTQLIEFETRGLSTEGLPRKSNGLPPPLTREIIDTDANPGRYRLRRGYVEQVAGAMWFGPQFWTRTGGAAGDLKALFPEDFHVAEDGIARLFLPGGVIADAETANRFQACRAAAFPGQGG